MAEDLSWNNLPSEEKCCRHASLVLALFGILVFSNIVSFIAALVQPAVPDWLFLLLATLPVQVCNIACGVVPALYYLPGKPLREMLNLKALHRQDLTPVLAGTAGVYLALAVLTGAIVYLLEKTGIPAPEQPVIAIFRSGSPLQKGILIVSSVILAPVGEEICYRCVIFKNMELIAGRVPAVWISALLFSAAHLNLRAFPALLLLGVWLTVLYRKTGTLLAPMTAHALFNGITILLLAGGAS